MLQASFFVAMKSFLFPFDFIVYWKENPSIDQNSAHETSIMTLKTEIIY